MTTADDYRKCRRVSHRWDELDGPPLGYGNTPRDAFWLRCDRCGMVRAFQVSASYGEVVWTRYWPPPGYYYERKRGSDDAAPTKQEYRLDWLREIRRNRS